MGYILLIFTTHSENPFPLTFDYTKGVDEKEITLLESPVHKVLRTEFYLLPTTKTWFEPEKRVHVVFQVVVSCF